MIQLCMDPIALCVIMYFLNRDEASEIGKLFLVCLGIAVVNVAIVLALAQVLGVLVLVPVLIADGAILKWGCNLTWPGAAIVLALFAAYKIAFEVAINLLFSA